VRQSGEARAPPLTAGEKVEADAVGWIGFYFEHVNGDASEVVVRLSSDSNYPAHLWSGTREAADVGTPASLGVVDATPPPSTPGDDDADGGNEGVIAAVVVIVVVLVAAVIAALVAVTRGGGTHFDLSPRSDVQEGARMGHFDSSFLQEESPRGNDPFDDGSNA